MEVRTEMSELIPALAARCDVSTWGLALAAAGMGFILLSVRKAEPTFGSLALGLLGGVLTWAGFVVALPW
jgi:hypothetical protein